MRRPRSAQVESDASATPIRERIIDATIESLRDDGFAGTSARGIARRGGFNQALIFYHFGSLIDLLVATLERVSTERIAEYEHAVEGVDDVREALKLARRQYADDVARGHIAVLTELVAGASSLPQLAPEVVRCIEPWLAFTEAQIRRLLAGTPLAALVPPRQAAQAVIALYLGMEMLDHLDPDRSASTPLFALADRMQRAAAPLLARQRRGPAQRPARVSLEAD